MSTDLPVWERLELRHRKQGGELELLLFSDGHLQGCARMRIRDAIVVAPPSGPSWAVPILEEALEEGRRCGGAP